MFGLFKKKNLLSNWKIPMDNSFDLIDNGDSMQFANVNKSRILYFSILSVTGKSSVLSETYKKMQPSMSNTENGWQLKGAKNESGEILICIFSFTDENDQQWAMDLFTSIFYTGKAQN